MQHLDPEAADNRTLFGWNYYPDPQKCKLRPDQLRLLPHADTDVITLLFQKPGSRLLAGSSAAFATWVHELYVHGPLSKSMTVKEN